MIPYRVAQRGGVMVRVLGVDPGATTGLSLIADGRVIGEWEARSLLKLWNLLHCISPDVIVVESFLGHPRAPRDSEGPIKVIGICELYAEEKGIALEYSNPSGLQGRPRPRGLSPHVWSAWTHATLYLERLEQAAGGREERSAS